MVITASILTVLAVGIAVYSGLKVSSPKGSDFTTFFLNTKPLSDNQVVSTLVATNTALALIVFWFSYLGWLYGLGASFWLSVCWIAGLYIFKILQSRFSEFSAQKTKEENQPPFQTLHEFVARSSNSNWPRRALALVSIVTFLLMMNVELTRGIRIFDSIGSGGHEHWIDFVALGLLIGAGLYTAWGGFSAVLRTDEVQWFITFLALGVASYLGCTSLGDWSNLFGSVYDPQNFSWSHFFLIPTQPYFILGSLFSWSLWFLVTMDMWQRAAAARRIEIINKSTIRILIPWFIFLTVTSVIIGLSVRVALPNDFGQTFPAVTFLSLQMERLSSDSWGILGWLLFGTMIAGFVSAMISTLDTYFISVSHSILRDLPDRNRKIPWESDNFPKWLAAIVTTGVALVLFPTYLVISHSSFSINTLLYLATTSPFILVPAVLFTKSKNNRSSSLIGSVILGVLGTIIIISYILHQISISGVGELEQWYNYLYIAPIFSSFFALIGYGIGLIFQKK